MKEWSDKYLLIAGDWLSSGLELHLPLQQAWPERLGYENGGWVRRPEGGFNVFRLMQVAQERGYTSPLWLGLSDGEAAGGQLKAGAEGVYVAAWRHSQTTPEWTGDVSATHFDEATPVQPGLPDDESQAVALRPLVVFNAQEWQGLENTLPAYSVRVLPTPEEALYRAEQIAQRGADCPIRHEGTTAYYNPTLNYIVVPDKTFFTNVKDYYMALFEQIGHAVAGRHQLGLWEGSVPEAEMAKDPAFKALYAKMVAALLRYESGIDVL